MPPKTSLKKRVKQVASNVLSAVTHQPPVILRQNPTAPISNILKMGRGNRLGHGQPRNDLYQSTRKKSKIKDSSKGPQAHPPASINSERRLELIPAPTSFGSCMSNVNDFYMGGRPQLHDRYTAGIRAVGNGFFRFSASPDTAGLPGLTVLNTNATSTNNIFGQNAGSNETGYVRRVTPAALGNRMAIQASLYRFYAIRHLRITYVPFLGTSTAGQVAISVIRDPYSLLNSASSGTSESLNLVDGQLVHRPSIMTPVWSPCSLEYRYSGPEVFSVWAFDPDPAAGRADIEEHVQLLIGGASSGISGGTQFGRIMVEYTIDFYEPGTVMDLNKVSMSQNNCFTLKHLRRYRAPAPALPAHLSCSVATPHLCDPSLKLGVDRVEESKEDEMRKRRLEHLSDVEAESDDFLAIRRPLSATMCLEKSDGTMYPLGACTVDSSKDRELVLKRKALQEKAKS